MEKKRKERGFGGVAADLETSRVHKNRPQMLSEAKKEYIDLRMEKLLFLKALMKNKFVKHLYRF